MNDFAMPEPTRQEKARRKAERLADKKAFDAEARRHSCSRCPAREVVTRLREETSREPGILDIDRWLCRECTTLLSEFVTECRAAEREVQGPLREAEMAERRQALAEKQAEHLERVNRERAECGQPPIVPKKAAASRAKPKRRKSPASPAD